MPPAQVQGQALPRTCCNKWAKVGREAPVSSCAHLSTRLQGRHRKENRKNERRAAGSSSGELTCTSQSGEQEGAYKSFRYTTTCETPANRPYCTRVVVMQGRDEAEGWVGYTLSHSLHTRRQRTNHRRLTVPSAHGVYLPDPAGRRTLGWPRAYCSWGGEDPNVKISQRPKSRWTATP